MDAETHRDRAAPAHGLARGIPDRHRHADHAQTVRWIRSPAVSIALLLTIAALFHHAQLGLQVVIEDYVHGEGKKLIALIAVKLLAIALAATAAFSVFRIAFGG